MIHEFVISLVFVALVIGPVFLLMRTRTGKEVENPPISHNRS
jgi:uncharacterized protein YneF (UPF0154 family)